MASRDEYYKQYLNDLATQYQGQIDTETKITMRIRQT